MNAPRQPALKAMLVAAALLSGCAPKTAKIDPSAPPADVLVVLVPDTETGTVGRVVVSNQAGRTELASPYASARVTGTRAPRARALREGDVKRIFGDALAALPPPPLHFTLFFRFDSEELTSESRALVQDVLTSVKSQPVPDVLVIGHTDTMGTELSNFELGMRRANAVRAILIDAGLSPSVIDVRSHGELELLVPTKDEVFEPKNRRVEITVR